jgi:hypothetical protein
MTTQQLNWDVRTDGGSLVTDLDALATVLGSDRDLAAKTLLASPSLVLAPAGLVQEAQEQVKAFPPKPGGGTPPPISSGTFVSWSGGRGRVDLVVTNGKVPGIDDEVEGSKDSPACRVVVWEKDGDGYKPGRKKIGAMAKTLKRIPPLRSGKKSAAVTGATKLVEMMADHEQRITDEGLGDEAKVSGAAVKSVYERGCASWPGVLRTGLTREEWGQGRVKAFLDTAAGAPMNNYVHDLGLLAKEHPMHPESKAIMSVTPSDQGGVDYVTLDQKELTEQLNALLNSPTEE